MADTDPRTVAETVRWLRTNDLDGVAELIEALRKDAERYRWLRAIGSEQGNVMAHYAGPELDARIDAALADQQPPSNRWRHVKSGREFTSIGVGLIEADDLLAEGAMVNIYRGDDGRLWVRPCNEFEQRFVLTDQQEQSK